MNLPQRLSARIVLAFVLMTTVVAGGFALSLKFAIDWAELQLVSRSLERQLDFILQQDDLPSQRALGPDLQLHAFARGTPPATLPAFARDRPPGFHEYEHGDQAWHFLVRDVRDRRYVLLLDQYDFEQRENRLQRIVLSGFVISVLLAWLLGHLLARRVMAPVIRLAGQVRQRDQLLPMAPSLAADYDRDEVGQLAAAFDATLGQLRDALERERLFTSDISHELRTPLMIIASSCELLDSDALDAAHRRRVVARIAHASAEMRTLVEAFLELARTPTPTHRTEHGGIDLDTAAHEQHARWEPEAHRRDISLVLEGRADPATRYSAPLLATVLSNLLRNALHHTTAGTVKLELRDHGFSVTDNGPGIAEGERQRVFAPFARGHDSQGAGIGLSLVDRICRKQGWQVSIHTPEHGGCEFRVELAPGGTPPSHV